MKTQTPPSSVLDRHSLMPISETLAPILPDQGEDAREKSNQALSPDDAWQRWRDSKDEQDFHKVVKALEPTVNKGLNTFGDGQKHLKTRARLLAADAVRSYDPDRMAQEGRNKASLSTYTYSHLQRLQRIAADRKEAVRVPERSRMDAIMLRDEVREWVDEHGEEPDIGTLGDRTGLSRKRILLAARPYREISASGLLTDKGDTLLQQESTIEDDPWRDYVYNDLDAKSRKIFEWKTGYGGSKTLMNKEIAKRLKISEAAVSSRINTIQRRLEERPGGKLV